MKTPMQELISFLNELNSDKTRPPDLDRMLLQKWCETKLLEKEKQNKKQECIEFSKYIRNGKDHFNNGYSTEMVYDEWMEKYKKQQE